MKSSVLTAFDAFRVPIGLILVIVIANCCVGQGSDGYTVLNDWEVSIDGGKSFQKVPVPSTIENAIDVTFDGVSVYRSRLPAVQLAKSQRAFLHFSAVATEAKVFMGEALLGEHLGGWTPFQVEITKQLQGRSSDDQQLEIKVVVDERVGHNTQGFLPIVTNHFSGNWQPVHLQVTNSACLLRDQLGIVADAETGTLQIVVPASTKRNDQSLKINDDKLGIELSVAEFEKGQPRQWKALQADLTQRPFESPSNRELESSAIVFEGVTQKPQWPWKVWTPSSPHRYALRVRLMDGNSIADETELLFGVRSFRTRGDQFVLNGQPISLRGVLNWGYAPPSLAPSLDPTWMRQEILFARSRGFNMMKFCLFIPPKAYLDLCDELGMLVWLEYPTWHPKLDQQHLAELRREYSEFFAYDRNHPSIILRSLTCETGSSAELAVIQSLYDHCKQMIPGAIVEDDSSWISWNRIHDFYDDHPYGNNHTWVKTLSDLKSYMATRDRKPLALGEAIAADTWILPTEAAIATARNDVAHGSWSIEDNQRWIDRLMQVARKNDRSFEPARMYNHSLHYGMLMRKYQVETLHREMPNAGYVVSVIRDFPKASMGLIDSSNRAKNTPADWSFQSDLMLLLRTRNDRRSFDGGTRESIEIALKQLGHDGTKGKLSVVMIDADGRELWNTECRLEHRDDVTAQTLELPIPIVDSPKRLTIQSEWIGESDKSPSASNSWPIWVFPSIVARAVPSVEFHSSAIAQSGQLAWLAQQRQSDESVIISSVLDTQLLDQIENGQSVLLIPNGQTGSFPLSSHWFLRGSVVALPKNVELASSENWSLEFDTLKDGQSQNQNMIVELQHFDLASQVVPNIGHYLDQVDPLVLLWDNHDMRETRTHGLAFRMRLGRGQLFVSALNHVGETNSVGRWLLNQWLIDLSRRELTEPDASGQDLMKRLRAEVNRKELSLATNAWKFKPEPPGKDGTSVGERLGWSRMDFSDEDWSEIRIDRHWEGQGFASLDHWAWYRTKVELPADWTTKKLHLNLNGIDDYADIFVNGSKVGSVGDIANKQTAFEIRKSLDVTRFVDANSRQLQISICVYDWFGAGGIFRPITLSTEPLSENPLILK